MSGALFVPDEDMPYVGAPQVIVEGEHSSAWITEDDIHALVAQDIDENFRTSHSHSSHTIIGESPPKKKVSPI
jgi:hypothetical protein